MPVRHLTTSQLQAILRTRGIPVPPGEQPQSLYAELCLKNGVTEVSFTELAKLVVAPRKPPATAATAARPASSAALAAAAAAEARVTQQQQQQQQQQRYLPAMLLLLITS